ncbi:DUF4333 domain-containing protein [Blastococcus sp. CT_GayMR16]|uniref:DUF4333 domain-containing protein n=1 Tax=Blastococcus sp. CT_GayMR16 TaxID=2559607 RepID=UPI0010749189|nr:DUF4333 domain-containing protein [Blastococcus sp. CT_GayMR16]TFV87136.1 DUF4333 domain-containing protein [Blastococcus sp. CT_GayMR16]
MSRRLRELAVLPFLLAGLAACSASVGSTSTLSADEVASSAEDALEEQIGVRPTISCPEDLEAKVGEEARCTLTGGDDPTEYGVTVRVTSVDGNDATFDVEVDEEPLG